jgi:vacuolar protein sorting-associated protein 35
MSLYDEDITTNKYTEITNVIGTCQKVLHVFSEENCDAIRQNCVARAAKLLKKPDQCRAVALCSHLFWDCKESRDGHSVWMIASNFLTELYPGSYF